MMRQGKGRAQEREVGPTTLFWQKLTEGARAERISEYAKLAELAFVIVPGSVEDARTFSSMNYIKNKHRNRLQEKHLNVCAALFQQRWWQLHATEGADSAPPVADAVKKWREGSRRGRYMIA
jgi:hypothetical protein